LYDIAYNSITNDITNDLGLISVPEALSACPAKTLYHQLRKKEMLKDLQHLVDLEFNYLIAMDEDDKDIDIGKNDHLLDF